jgi:hypothetical protein
MYLDGNLLTTLDSKLLQSQNKLRMLELQDNKLTSVNTELLKPLLSLRTFNLSGNPLLCDCALWDAWLWWSARALNPFATCQLPEISMGVSVRQQLQNLVCNAERTGNVQPAVSQTRVQAESSCDVRNLTVGCLIILIIICAIMIGFFVYITSHRKHTAQEMLLPLQANGI